MSTTTASTQTSASASESTRAIVIAVLLGLGLVFMTGFAPAMALHNAAHDFRHTQNFPCH
ncbi:CbtB domain-containing protein [Methylobacterium haplocladii]|uniref:Cobalt transporter n=1 Tax=Methylobacterium haplocladii TaxID=1176176 RepID=A0A512IIX0_9HYPH|nr:CbtB-domain containing protein [Methylobacterium haplocladii]GEO97653.1 hypothetical protein MHA02_00410 [Methylobacterium haplocladii]GJD84472.1 hypothetical protein HPGCJGGD_2349 [Methylobacterium haplocladii]GLS57383.1 hypothetical protein GCM10007887_00380 [Methylobacterium haplocladii]